MTEWKRLGNLGPTWAMTALATLVALALPAGAADRMVIAEYFTSTT